VLYTLDTRNLKNDTYFVRLKVYENDSQLYSEDTMYIYILNDTTIVDKNKSVILTDKTNTLKIEAPINTFKKETELLIYTNPNVSVNPQISRISEIFTIAFDSANIIPNGGLMTISIKVDNEMFNKLSIKHANDNLLVLTDNRSFSAGSTQPRRLAPTKNQLTIFYNNNIDDVWQNLGGVYNPLTDAIEIAYNQSGNFIIGYSPSIIFNNIQSSQTSNIQINRKILTISTNERIIFSNVSQNCELQIFDLNGRLIKTLKSNYWDGLDKTNKSVKAGLYIIKVNDANISQKFIVYVR